MQWNYISSHTRHGMWVVAALCNVLLIASFAKIRTVVVASHTACREIYCVTATFTESIGLAAFPIFFQICVVDFISMLLTYSTLLSITNFFATVYASFAYVCVKTYCYVFTLWIQYVAFTSAKFNFHNKHAITSLCTYMRTLSNVKPAHERGLVCACVPVCVVARICVNFRTDFAISIQKNVSLHFVVLLPILSLSFRYVSRSPLAYCLFIDRQFSSMRRAPSAQWLPSSRA